jgi:hypothetical protein
MNQFLGKTIGEARFNFKDEHKRGRSMLRRDRAPQSGE